MKETEKYKLTLESITANHINKDELVAINGNGNPQELYLSHRKGFVISNEDLMNPKKIKSMRFKGCKYIIVNKHSYNRKLEYNEIFDNKDYKIYEIED